MLHIDPETLRRRPILGVVIGGATAIVLAWLVMAGMGEGRSLLGQKGPAPLSVHAAVTARGTRWVTISGGRWHCESAIPPERPVGLERWVRGPIETTEVPI